MMPPHFVVWSDRQGLIARIVFPIQGVVMNIGTNIKPVFHANRITTHPSRQPRRVVPCAVIIQAALLVALFPREAIALFRKAAKAGLPIGKVLLAVDQSIIGGARPPDDQVATAEVVAQLILDVRLLVVGVTDAPDGNATLVVHHVQAIVLFGGWLADFLPLVILKDAINVDCAL